MWLGNVLSQQSQYQERTNLYGRIQFKFNNIQFFFRINPFILLQKDRTASMQSYVEANIQANIKKTQLQFMSALTNTYYMHIQHILLHPHSYEPRITESSIPNRHRWSAELVYKTSMKPKTNNSILCFKASKLFAPVFFFAQKHFCITSFISQFYC